TPEAIEDICPCKKEVASCTSLSICSASMLKGRSSDIAKSLSMPSSACVHNCDPWRETTGPMAVKTPTIMSNKPNSVAIDANAGGMFQLRSLEVTGPCTAYSMIYKLTGRSPTHTIYSSNPTTANAAPLTTNRHDQLVTPRASSTTTVIILS